MKAIGLTPTAAIRARFPLFVSTGDAYGFLRNEALTADVQAVEPYVIFDPASVPLPWFEANAGARKACVLRDRRDVEMFLTLMERVSPTVFGLSDLVLVWDRVALNGNERAVLRAAHAAFFPEIEEVLAPGGLLDAWLEQPRRLFSGEAALTTDFHILRYRSAESPLAFKRLVSGDFLFEEDVGISATAIVVDAPSSLRAAREIDRFNEVFVFLGVGVSTLETISLFRAATGHNPMIADQVAYSVEGISKTLIQLRLA